MKHRFTPLLLAALGLVLIASSIHAAEVVKPLSRNRTVAGKIQEVTVFSDRALVVRQAGIKLLAGEQTLSFKDLTGSLDPDSVQVKGTGAAAIKGIKIEPVYLDEAKDGDLKGLKDKLEVITEQIEMINATIGHARQEKKFIESITKRLTTASDKSDQAELNPQKWIAMVTFYRSKISKLDKEVRLNKKALKPLQKKKQKIDQEIRELRGRIQHKKFDVRVILTSAKGGTGSLQLSYIVRGPYWQPKYDVRADSKKAKVQVAYHANIRQNTGEDWRRAKISLSTASPRSGDKHPELGPWRITPYYPKPIPKPSRHYGRNKKMRASAPVMEAAMEMDYAKEAPPMQAIQATAKASGTAVNFDIKGKHTIKSDNQPHQVTIMIQQFPATFKYSTVPKLVSQAYLKAEIKNETDFPMLAGESNIFLDNNFVASGSIDTVAPSETFWAFLGIDEGIKVEYKVINREQAKQGVFGGRVKIVYDYLIKVTNHKKQAHDLVIQDQLPIGGHKEIKIELISPTYHAKDESFKKDNQNLLEWHKTIKAGEKIEIPFKFSVSYPENMKVQGL